MNSEKLKVVVSNIVLNNNLVISFESVNSFINTILKESSNNQLITDLLTFINNGKNQDIIAMFIDHNREDFINILNTCIQDMTQANIDGKITNDEILIMVIKNIHGLTKLIKNFTLGLVTSDIKVFIINMLLFLILLILSILSATKIITDLPTEKIINVLNETNKTYVDTLVLANNAIDILTDINVIVNDEEIANKCSCCLPFFNFIRSKKTNEPNKIINFIDKAIKDEPLLNKEATKAEETKVEEPKVEETKETKAEEPKVEETKETKAEETKVEEPKVEETKETKAEEPKAEETKVEEPKAE